MQKAIANTPAGHNLINMGSPAEDTRKRLHEAQEARHTERLWHRLQRLLGRSQGERAQPAKPWRGRSSAWPGREQSYLGLQDKKEQREQGL